ncbi:ATP-dependent DNA ligase, partial [Altererythrobacter lutimaris]|nr:ATP-dependent DNA ligase [Altererythrobacter lutimaris]
SDAFPDIAGAFDADAVVDGELLVRGDVQGGQAASFNALQQRLGRKTVTAKMLRDAPAFVRLYDILIEGDDDLRPLTWSERRKRLEAFVPKLDQSRFDISQLIPSDSYDDLAEVREGARDAAIEGVMLKRKDSPYIAGRKTGLWYKWKRDPLVADCVMMYAQRGSGKRSSFYS